MEISLVFQQHPDADIWEEYVFGRVSQQQEAALEDHLLLCEHCQGVLARTEEFVRLMKAGTASFPGSQRRTTLFRLSPQLPRLPLPVTSALVIACLAVLIWIGTGRNHWIALRPIATSTIQVPLKSLRAGGEAAVTRAPAHHPLDLSVHQADVPQFSAYRFEVVTIQGAPVWSGPADARDGAISAHVPKALAAGTYWVRLYGSPQDLLVEYGLKLD